MFFYTGIRNLKMWALVYLVSVHIYIWLWWPNWLFCVGPAKIMPPRWGVIGLTRPLPRPLPRPLAPSPKEFYRKTIYLLCRRLCNESWRKQKHKNFKQKADHSLTHTHTHTHTHTKEPASSIEIHPIKNKRRCHSHRWIVDDDSIALNEDTTSN